MILGIDHIALSSRDIFKTSLFLEKLGLTPQFCENSLPNHSAKKTFLTNYTARHGMGYFSSRGISLEITLHDSPIVDHAPAYEILIELPASLSGCIDSNATIWNTPLGSFYELQIPAADSVWVRCNPNEVDTGIVAVVLRTPDIQSTVDFWKDFLGFSIIDHSEGNFCVMEKKSFIPTWGGKLVLIACDQGEPGFLDCRGSQCMALISSDIYAEQKIIQGVGTSEITEVFSLKVNQVNLKIMLFRALVSNEIIEIIFKQK